MAAAGSRRRGLCPALGGNAAQELRGTSTIPLNRSIALNSAELSPLLFISVRFCSILHSTSRPALSQAQQRASAGGRALGKLQRIHADAIPQGQENLSFLRKLLMKGLCVEMISLAALKSKPSEGPALNTKTEGCGLTASAKQKGIRCLCRKALEDVWMYTARCWPRSPQI